MIPDVLSISQYLVVSIIITSSNGGYVFGQGLFVNLSLCLQDNLQGDERVSMKRSPEVCIGPRNNITLWGWSGLRSGFKTTIWLKGLPHHLVLVMVVKKSKLAWCINSWLILFVFANILKFAKIISTITHTKIITYYCLGGGLVFVIFHLVYHLE